uniref:L1 transposable element RRM domain-containing protein n=1 Tax=Moschus moschiferus TaxID=68415 RepID=A0A8C6CRM6_MOSMO
MGHKMKRQRNTQQVKEQDKCPPTQTKEEDIGNLPDKEFRILMVKMIQNLESKMELQINNLEKRIEKMKERFNKDLEEIKKSQYTTNNAIDEIRNTLEGTNSRITEAEDRISELEDRIVEINETERKKEKQIKRNEDNIRHLWDSVKRPNIRIIGIPEEDKKKDHDRILEEIILENFPKMGKEIITQVQETQRVPNRINPRRNTPRHILIKLTKIKHKEQILKAAREKEQITHKGIPIRITADLSTETLQARREWQDILKVMKEKSNLQPRLLYPARISFKYEGEIKSFTDKQKLREFSITKPALRQIQKDLL